MNEYQVIVEPDLRRTTQVKGLIRQMLDGWDERKKPVLTYREYNAFLQMAYLLREVAESEAA